MFFERFDWLATSKDQIAMRYNYNTFHSPGSATSNPISTTGYTAYVERRRAGSRRPRPLDARSQPHAASRYARLLLAE